MKRIDMLRYGELCGLVKNVKRAGWLRYLPSSEVESVGDHSAKIAFLSLAVRGIENVNLGKCIEMALIHDIAEGIVGDYTPYDKITKQEKHQQQLKAIEKIFEPLGPENKQYYVSRWKEHEEGLTFESLIVRDLDKLEMMQQAYEYQKKHLDLNLSEFFKSHQQLKTQIVKCWANELIQERNIMKKASNPQHILQI